MLWVRRLRRGHTVIMNRSTIRARTVGWSERGHAVGRVAAVHVARRGRRC